MQRDKYPKDGIVLGAIGRHLSTVTYMKREIDFDSFKFWCLNFSYRHHIAP